MRGKFKTLSYNKIEKFVDLFGGEIQKSFGLEKETINIFIHNYEFIYDLEYEVGLSRLQKRLNRSIPRHIIDILLEDNNDKQ